ncbi:DUF748 domain-containing protein [Colwelliaceae bacterium 6471]
MSPTIFAQLKRILMWLVVVIFILYCLIWAVSSPLIKYVLTTPLAEYKLTLSSDSRFIYNPFLTRLSVKNVVITQQDTRVLALKKLDLQVSLYQLIFDNVAIQIFNIDELYLEANIEKDHIVVAGIDINALQKNKPTDTEKSVTVNEQPARVLRVLMSKLNLSNSEVVISNQGETHRLVLNALSIKNAELTPLQQTFSLDLDGVIDEGKLLLNAAVDIKGQAGVIHSNLSLQQYQLEPLKSLLPQLHQLTGIFGVQTEQVITLQNNKVTADIKLADISLQDGVVGQGDFVFKLANYDSGIENLKVTIIPEESVAITGTVSVTLSNGQLLLGDEKDELLRFENIALDKILLAANSNVEAAADKALNVTIDSIVVDNIVTSKKASQDLPAIAKLTQFAAENITLTQDSISIDKVIVDGLDSYILLGKDKQLANLVQLRSNVEDKPQNDVSNNEIAPAKPQEASEDNADTPAFHFSVNSVEMINNNQLVFTDNSVDPVYTRTLFVDKFSMGAISSKDKNQQTPYEISGRSDKYTQYNFNGFMQPLLEQPIYKIKGQLDELSLPSVSTYMKDALQFELSSGQLDSKIDLTLTGEEMDGKVKLVIRGLDTTAADDHEVNTLKDQTAIPLNVALDMLKDSDGVIKLTLPFSGLVSSSKSGFTSIITLVTKKAVMSATQSYLMKTFVPYANVLTVVMGAGEFLLKVRFEDLIYQKQQIALSTEQESYAQQFMQLMKDKPDTQVKVCAISTPAEIGLALDEQVTDKADITRLKEIASARAEAFKEYVIEHSDIKSARLLLCSPQIDSSKNAKPKIKIFV